MFNQPASCLINLFVTLCSLIRPFTSIRKPYVNMFSFKYFTHDPVCCGESSQHKASLHNAMRKTSHFIGRTMPIPSNIPIAASISLSVAISWIRLNPTSRWRVCLAWGPARSVVDVLFSDHANLATFNTKSHRKIFISPKIYSYLTLILNQQSTTRDILSR